MTAAKPKGQTIPEIRIQYSPYLTDAAAKAVHQTYLPQVPDNLTAKDYDERAESYRQAWRRHEQKILQSMCEALDLSFRKPIIDVSLAPWIRPISFPLIISFQYDPKTFVDVLMHELWHDLLDDNSIFSAYGKSYGQTTAPLLKKWTDWFGTGRSPSELEHILVHAGSKYIYLDVLREPERLERDKQRVGRWPDYKAAWDYVEAHDYKDILKKLKESYQNYETK